MEITSIDFQADEAIITEEGNMGEYEGHMRVITLAITPNAREVPTLREVVVSLTLIRWHLARKWEYGGEKGRCFIWMN